LHALNAAAVGKAVRPAITANEKTRTFTRQR
jgi:hypothetical protein